ncbi:MAG TPA: hypothetical protein VGI85_01385 [Chthoniobacterales bacterium]|jgi:hypothetical protein
MSPRNKKFNPRIDGRLAAYAAVAGAALAAPALPNANADVVNSGVVNINIPSTTAGIYLNVQNGVFATTPGGAPGWDLNLWSSSGLEIWGNNSADPTGSNGVLDNFPGGSSATLVDNIPIGSVVNSSFTFGQVDSSVETTGPTAFVLNSNQNYFGFRFFNEATGQTDFGYGQISLSSTLAGQPRLLVQYSYDNMGNPITVVPEPTTFALFAFMAVGALGVREWRKRKAA